MAGKECDTFDAAFFSPCDSAVFGRLEIGFQSRLGILFRINYRCIFENF